MSGGETDSVLLASRLHIANFDTIEGRNEDSGDDSESFDEGFPSPVRDRNEFLP
jgi:hypothetical protein